MPCQHFYYSERIFSALDIGQAGAAFLENAGWNYFVYLLKHSTPLFTALNKPSSSILLSCVYPPAKAGHMAKRRMGVEYSPSMLEPVRPGAVSPDRALCLPTFSHFLIVNKTSLPPPPPHSLSLSHSLQPSSSSSSRSLARPSASSLFIALSRALSLTASSSWPLPSAASLRPRPWPP